MDWNILFGSNIDKSKWEKLYNAALKNDAKEVAYQLTQINAPWPYHFKTVPSKKLGDIKLDTIQRANPVYAAVINLTDQSGEIAYQIAEASYKHNKTVQTRFFMHENVLSAAYKLLIDAEPEQWVWARRLIKLANENLVNDYIVKGQSYQFINTIPEIFKEFYKLREFYPYTIAKMFYDTLNLRPYNPRTTMKLFGYTQNTVPQKDLEYIFKVWTLFGNGPYPSQVRQIIKYDHGVWGEERIETIIKTLIKYGYNFNAKYISKTTNEPVYFSLYNTQKYLIELILAGRADTSLTVNGKPVDQIFKESGNKDLVSAVDARDYVENADIKELCAATKLDKYQRKARLNVIRDTAYKLQLKNTKNAKNACMCIKNIIDAEQQGIIPYKDIETQRSTNKCNNDYTLSMAPINEISPSQLVIFEDTDVKIVNDKGKKVHPQYCFDKGSIKELLNTGINPYTNNEFPDIFLDRLFLDAEIIPTAIELEETIQDITKDSKLPIEPQLSDFRQTLERFTAIFSKFNPYLNYEKWATQYTKDDYKKDVTVGFGQNAIPSFVQSLDLGGIDATLLLEEYVTLLMATILNRLMDNNISINTVLSSLTVMLAYIPAQENIAEVPVDVDPYADMTKDALTAKKGELTKQFIAGGMKDQTLMKEIQKIRQRLIAMDE